MALVHCSKVAAALYGRRRFPISLSSGSNCAISGDLEASHSFAAALGDQCCAQTSRLKLMPLGGDTRQSPSFERKLDLLPFWYVSITLDASGQPFEPARCLRFRSHEDRTGAVRCQRRKVHDRSRTVATWSCSDAVRNIAAIDAKLTPESVPESRARWKAAAHRHAVAATRHRSPTASKHRSEPMAKAATMFLLAGAARALRGHRLHHLARPSRTVMSAATLDRTTPTKPAMRRLPRNRRLHF